MAAPDEEVSLKRLRPSDDRPPGLGNREMEMLPTVVDPGVALVVTETVPSEPIVTESASGGMIIGG